MVEFLPCRDPEQIRTMCTDAGIPYAPQIHAYTAVQDETQIGFALFLLEPERVFILHIPNDDYLADVLVRSAMNSALLRGIEMVNFSRSNNTQLLKLLNFVTGDINLDVPIKNFIHDCKNCANSQGKSC